MKTTHSLAVAFLVLSGLNATASAAERKSVNRVASRGPAKLQSSGSLQGATGLATGSINGNGANPVAERLSDDAWRTLFPVKKPETR